MLNGDFILCVSTPILLEYEEVLIRKTTPTVARNVLRLLLLLPNVENVQVHFRWNLIDADPDDNKFVDAALAAGADALVTHDHHFDLLHHLDFPRLPIWTADGFRQMLAE